MKITRRNLLKGLAGAGGVALAGTGAEASEAFSGHPHGRGVLHDTTLCIGCRSCEAACREVNGLPELEAPPEERSVFDRKRRPDESRYTVVNRYETTQRGRPSEVYRKVQCNHCMEPACASACFVRAFDKTPEGAVTYNPDVCVGCRYCMIACPFNMPAYEYGEPFSPRVVKCTLCRPRVLEGQLPGCVEACPMEALIYGEREELIAVGRERIRKHPDRYVNHIYGEREMGGTSWLYLAGVPFDRIGLRTDLGDQPAPLLSKGYLSLVPFILTLWPAFLLGCYAFTQQRERNAQQETQRAVVRATRETEARLSAVRPPNQGGDHGSD